MLAVSIPQVRDSSWFSDGIYPYTQPVLQPARYSRLAKKSSSRRKRTHPAAASPEAAPATAHTVPEPASRFPFTELVIGLVVFVGFIAFVYGFAANGGPFVDRLSGETGEVLAARGQAQREAGNVAAAITYYRRAVAASFENASERAAAAKTLAELLLQSDRPREAAIAAREAVELAPGDQVALEMLARAYRESAQFTELEQLAERAAESPQVD